MNIPIPPTTECRLWKGSITPEGYGRFWVKEKYKSAHRFAYTVTRGPIPEGATIDHLCRRRSCIRPSHLEAVTRKINILRGIGCTAINARKIVCTQGHPLNATNTYIRPDNKSQGERVCKTCRREWQRQWNKTNRLHRNSVSLVWYHRSKGGGV